MDVAKQNPFVELKKNHTITFVKNQNQLFYNYFVTFAGTSAVTPEPAPIIAPSPTVI